MTARLALPKPVTRDRSPLRFDVTQRPAEVVDDSADRARAVVHAHATTPAEAALFLEALGLVEYAPGGRRTNLGRAVTS